MDIVNESLDSNCLLIRLEGRFDAHGASEFAALLDSRMNNAVKGVVIDMAQVQYLSSAGIRELMKLVRLLKQRHGLIALGGVQDFCKQVLDTTGFTSEFKLFAQASDAVKYCQDLFAEQHVSEHWHELKSLNLKHGRYRLISQSASSGLLKITGDIKELLYSRIDRHKIRSRHLFDDDYAFGLGGFDKTLEECFDRIGNVMNIGGTLFLMPTDGNETADFVLPLAGHDDLVYFTPFSVSFPGEFDILVHFEANTPEGVTLYDLYDDLFSLQKTCLGKCSGAACVVCCGQIGAFYGECLRKAPISNNKPVNGKMIRHSSNLDDWYSIDTVARYRNTVGVIEAITIDLQEDLSVFREDMLERVFHFGPSWASLGKRFAARSSAALFQNVGVSRNPVDLEKEIGNLVRSGEFLDMRQIRDNSTLNKGIIGIGVIRKLVEADEIGGAETPREGTDVSGSTSPGETTFIKKNPELRDHQESYLHSEPRKQEMIKAYRKFSSRK